jgi:hypothetical protein
VIEPAPAAAIVTPAASIRRGAGRLAAALACAAMGLAGCPRDAWAGTSRTVSVTAGGLWPLASLAHELGVRHGLAITYEDLPRPRPGDASETQQPWRQALVEPEPIALRYEVDKASGLVTNPAAMLGDAISAHNKVNPRGSFRLELHGGIYHVLPATVRAADGSVRPVHSLLDVAIDLPEQERTVFDTLEAVLAAVGRAHGVSIHYMGWGSMEMKCRIGFSGVPAHAALEQLLAVIWPRGGLVWRILAAPVPIWWRDDYVVHLVRAEPNLGRADSVFEPDADPPEWQELGPENKPWRRLSMEKAAAFIASPAEGNRIAGYNAIVSRQESQLPIAAGERAALVAALLPLAEAGDSDSWYSTRVLASLALGSLHATEAVPVLLDHLQDDFPRPTQDSDPMLPPAAIALTRVGAPAIEPILARAATAGDDEWQLLLRTLRTLDRPDWRDLTAVSGPGTAQAASAMLRHGASGRERERLLALVPGLAASDAPVPATAAQMSSKIRRGMRSRLRRPRRAAIRQGAASARRGPARRPRPPPAAPANAARRRVPPGSTPRRRRSANR